MSSSNVNPILCHHIVSYETTEEDIRASHTLLHSLTSSLTPTLYVMYDRSKINVAKECWFLVDTMWLNAWSEFVNTEEGDPPGPISSKDLLNEEGNPIPGLVAKMDYRALPAISYFILKQLHGSDGSPDIPRYSVDIYKPAVPLHRLVSIQMTAVVS